MERFTFPIGADLRSCAKRSGKASAQVTANFMLSYVWKGGEYTVARVYGCVCVCRNHTSFHFCLQQPSAVFHKTTKLYAHIAAGGLVMLGEIKLLQTTHWRLRFCAQVSRSIKLFVGNLLCCLSYPLIFLTFLLTDSVLANAVYLIISLQVGRSNVLTMATAKDKFLPDRKTKTLVKVIVKTILY